MLLPAKRLLAGGARAQLKLHITALLLALHCAPPPPQLADAVQEARAATGSSDLRRVGCHLRSKHGYLVVLRRANVCRRPKSYLRMLRHTYLVVRGLDGGEGARGRAAACVGSCQCHCSVRASCPERPRLQQPRFATHVP